MFHFDHHMPSINLDSITMTADERVLADAIVATKGKNKGCLRASKPSNSGDAGYLWRMVAFQVSPISQHHCLPMCAYFDIEVPKDMTAGDERYQWRKNRAKELDTLVEKIVAAIPPSQWHGIRRWHKAIYG